MIDAEGLERLQVVANAAMNRQRGLHGVNSYGRELGLDIAAFLRERGRGARWMDLCCGSGAALVEAARLLPDARIEGIDLAGMFVPHEGVALREGSVRTWTPGERYDLVTCVHGLHYVADKLQALTVAAAALLPGGRLAANLDLDNVAVPGGRRALRTALCKRGFKYNARTHVVSFSGGTRAPAPFDWHFSGADPEAGPNYTHQPAVTSRYLDPI